MSTHNICIYGEEKINVDLWLKKCLGAVGFRT